MRAVNLIPADERRGVRAPSRAGILSYVLVGGLLLVLAGITSLVMTSNSIADKEAQISSLEQQQADAQARADALQAFADFGAMQEDRTATVTSLAQSRFDWERVMRELALVLPEGDVWLTSMSGTVSPAVSLDSAAGLSLRASVPGPALELVGCASSQDAVGQFVSTLRDIDGVTRVTVARSSLSEDTAPSQASSDPSGEESSQQTQTDDCRTRDFITQFEILAAFDEVPAPAAAPTTPGAPTDSTAPTDSSTSTDSAVPEQAEADSVADAQANTDQATNIAP